MSSSASTAKAKKSGVDVKILLRAYELMYTAKQIWADATNVREMMLTVLVFYVCLASLFAWGMTTLERRLRVPGVGQGGQA